jgi:SagB-type dehydrogenase family enzyme
MTQHRASKRAEPPANASAVAKGGPGAAQGEASYVDRANDGQRLLEQGHFQQAFDVFQGVLSGLPREPSYAHAAITERIGRCMLDAGKPAAAAAIFRQALSVTDKISLTDGVKGLRCMLQSSLGDAYRASDRPAEARGAYEAALAISKTLGDHRAHGVDLDHLGSLALAEGNIEDALKHYRAALDVFQAAGDRNAVGVAYHNMGRALHEAQRWEEAERHAIDAARMRGDLEDHVGAAQSWALLASIGEKTARPDAAQDYHRKGLEAARRSGHPVLLRHHLATLANCLRTTADGTDEAIELIHQALNAVSLETFTPDVWSIYGILGDLLERRATGAAELAAQPQFLNYRHVQQFGPRLQQTLSELSEEATLARAVLLARFGRCFLMGSRPDLAVTLLREAAAVAARLTGDDANDFHTATEAELGGALAAAGHCEAGRQVLSSALARARQVGNLRGEAGVLNNLRELAAAEGKPEEATAHGRAALALFDAIGDRAAAAALRQAIGADDAGSDAVRPDEANVASQDSDFSVTLHEETTVACVFDTDLMVDVGQRARRIAWAEEAAELAGDVFPLLLPQARPCLSEDGSIRFCLPFDEPVFEQQVDCVVMRKSRRDVAISGKPTLVWQLVRELDGTQSVSTLLAGIAPADRPAAARMLAAFAATGVIDTTGRPFGRFVHAATKKGVLPGGGLEGNSVLQLVTDGNYRVYPEAAQIPLSQSVPDRLSAFHELTRSRRSRRDYVGGFIGAEDFAALLNTACGVTGAMPWEGREVKLRAYPSSGALYAVEIYPIVFGVEGLQPGVYHYVPNTNALDAVRPDANYERIINAMLPIEREMVSGASAMICLVGRFRRHEHKYGPGGYRMMVAEAGHISQNLVLAGTALGLAARPFGGVFDSLLNQELGLDETEEQFLLSVLIGHGPVSNGQEHASGETE